jgi:hypothetical protein
MTNISEIRNILDGKTLNEKKYTGGQAFDDALKAWSAAKQDMLVLATKLGVAMEAIKKSLGYTRGVGEKRDGAVEMERGIEGLATANRDLRVAFEKMSGTTFYEGMNDMMRCPKCHKEYKGSMAKCPGCGEESESTEPVDEAVGDPAMVRKFSKNLGDLEKLAQEVQVSDDPGLLSQPGKKVARVVAEIARVADSILTSAEPHVMRGTRVESNDLEERKGGAYEKGGGNPSKEADMWNKERKFLGSVSGPGSSTNFKKKKAAKSIRASEKKEIEKRMQDEGVSVKAEIRSILDA